MYVVATAGHVDHGKSTLVRALTGIDPDRWAEEKRRGLTIDLGFAWTTLPSGADLAFVDVPGHERFVANMLAGVGPAPAVMIVVAADEGWMPQTEEHVRALRAFGARHALLVISKCDRAAPEPVVTAALPQLDFLGHLDVVTTSATTGQGVDELRVALDRLVASLPPPDPEAPVRLWVDRVFTISGAGTVITGTLPAGRIAVGDTLQVQPSGALVTVRGLESRQRTVHEISGTARVAVNVRGADRQSLRRGMALVTPESFRSATMVDVRTCDDVPQRVVTHIGAAGVPTRVRRLADGACRLAFDGPLPLHLGDRLLLREPASHALAGATVADLDPVPLRRRGDAGRVGRALHVPATADDEVARRGVTTGSALRTAGLSDEPTAAFACGEHWVSAPVWAGWEKELRILVADIDRLAPGVSIAAARRALGASSDDIVVALAAADPTLEMRAGRIAAAGGTEPELPQLRELLSRLARDPLAAPSGAEVRSIGRDALAHGARTGALLHLGGGLYVAPAAVPLAVDVLRELDQPFTVSAARQALGSSRRVVVPLLEHLDAARLTRPTPAGQRFVTVAER